MMSTNIFLPRIITAVLVLLSKRSAGGIRLLRFLPRMKAVERPRYNSSAWYMCLSHILSFHLDNLPGNTAPGVADLTDCAITRCHMMERSGYAPPKSHTRRSA
jgi:hypothetical protein